jgi:hypothetical protein
VKGQLTVGVCGDVKNREVVRDERIAKTAKSNRKKNELCLTSWCCERDPRTISARCAKQWQRSLREREKECDN